MTEGDNLDYIANLYQADAQAIVEISQLADASAISVGQELMIHGGQMPMPAEVEEEPTPAPEAEQVPAAKPRPQPKPEQPVQSEPAHKPQQEQVKPQ